MKVNDERPDPEEGRSPLTKAERSSAVRRWAASGAMALTGRQDGPALGPPDRLVQAVDNAAGGLVEGDPLALLGERAALLGLGRRSPSTCGGSGRLLEAHDGWIALSLARSSDIELMPAWLELDRPLDPDLPVDHLWALVRAAVWVRDVATLRDRAILLGLPASSLGADRGRAPVLTSRGRGDRPARTIAGARVVDLSSLWAGPLCGQILAAHGADVVKVESTTRPDGARAGEPGFFDLLNGAKRSVALDLTTANGRRALGGLIDHADVVIEASRPRALDQLGIRAERRLADGWPGVWLSITGYGRADPDAGRVAFGDDAAVAGGLVVWGDGEPRFCGDAIADPLTGMAAASACVDALATDGPWLIDVAMAAVAADASGPTLSARQVRVAPPRARPVTATAPLLGADTDTVLAELGTGP